MKELQALEISHNNVGIPSVLADLRRPDDQQREMSCICVGQARLERGLLPQSSISLRDWVIRHGGGGLVDLVAIPLNRNIQRIQLYNLVIVVR
jgi:hypothetical protein